jgi:hypothetical protein
LAAATDQGDSVIVRIRRLVVLLAALVGVLAVTEGVAHAGFIIGNHCEPLRRG